MPADSFELYSIPAHDRGGFDDVVGSEIGSSKQRVQPGDVMISKIVPHIRRARVVGPHRGPMQIASGEWIVFRTAKVEPRYFRQFLVSDLFHTQFMATVAGVGGSLLRARPAAVANLTIPLPPIEEQRRIAAILDHSDRVVSLLKAREAELASLEQAHFSAAFAGVPASATVDEVARAIRTGPFGSQLLHSEFVDEGVAVVGLDNVVGNEFRWAERRFITEVKFEQLKRYRLWPGDVLISIMGTTGRCVIVPDDIPLAINTKHVCAVTPDDQVSPRFLRAAFLWHPDSRAHLRRQTKGSIMDGLNMGIIKAMPLPVPTRPDQDAFSTQVAESDALLLLARAQAADASKLHAALQARAFSGRL